jgi:hypothetical protein
MVALAKRCFAVLRFPAAMPLFCTALRALNLLHCGSRRAESVLKFAVMLTQHLDVLSAISPGQMMIWNRI